LTDHSLTTPSENIRFRHVVKGSDHYYIVFNEGESDVSTKLKIPLKSYRQLKLELGFSIANEQLTDITCSPLRRRTPVGNLNKIPPEVHVFQKGGHRYGLALNRGTE
jgi:hypothetical protein